MTETQTAEPTSGAAVASDTTAPEKGQVDQPTSTKDTLATQAQPQPAQSPGGSDVPDDYVWEGNPDTLPKSLQSRARGVQRYLTKQSQSLAEEKKDAEAFRKLKSDPAFAEFQKGFAQGSPQTAPSKPAPLFTREDLEEAQVNPDKLGSLIERVTDAKVQMAQQQAIGVLSDLQTKQSFIDKKQELQDFAELHPDFWDLHEKGLMKPYLREIVDTGQGTLVDAYNKAKEVKEMFRREALQESQARVQQKKAAFSSTPSPSTEVDVIWANDKHEATRLAFENAVLGKKVQVKVKH